MEKNKRLQKTSSRSRRKKSIERQGLYISLLELEELRLEVIGEQLDLNKKLGLDIPIDYKRKFLINIVNRQGLSDTWEFE